MCLIAFLDATYNNINNGRLSEVVFLDLKKTFDAVVHHIRCCKLLIVGLTVALSSICMVHCGVH